MASAKAEATKWFPTASAPKDGRPLLLAVRGKNYPIVCSWKPIEGLGLTAYGWCSGEVRYGPWGKFQDAYLTDEPELWAPCPLPPEGRSDG